MNNKIPTDSVWSRLRQRWQLALFASVFAAVGAGFLFLAVIPTLWQSWQMQSWEQHDAHLLDAGTRINHGDDSNTYRAYADYRYEYNGLVYKGDRVSIIGASDNIGDFQQSLGTELKHALDQGRPVLVWINPDDPAEAVLNRDLRWGMILFFMVFVLVFGGVGTGLLLACFLSPANKIPESALQGLDVNSQPWLGDRNWANSTIHSDAKVSQWGIWFFAGLWNVIAIPAGIFVVPDVMGGDYAAAIVLFFPLIGIGLLTWAILATLRWRRFGKTPLALDPYPGSIGGQVGGTVNIDLPYQPDQMFKVTLGCYYSFMTGSGDDRRRTERVIWQRQGFAHQRPTSRGTRLEVLFDVADNLPQSDPQDNSRYHLWRLNIHCPLPGADFDRNFEIPVFPTSQQSRFLRQRSTRHNRAADHRKQEIEAVLDIKQFPGGIELYYPPYSNPLSKLIGMFCGIFFFAMGMVAGSQGAPLIFPVVFGLVGGLLALGCLYSLVVSLKVTMDQQVLRTRKTIFGIPVGGKRASRQEIHHLRLHKSFSQSSGGKHKQFFKIQAVTNDNRKINIGRNLPGENVARQAMESIATLTGLDTEPSHRTEILSTHSR